MNKTLKMPGAKRETKKDFRGTIRTLIIANPPWLPVDDNTFAILLDLLSHHPIAKEKIGVGVKSFWWKPNINALVPFLERTDGSVDDFSYVKCVDFMWADLHGAAA